jgi:uridylate kinase
VDGVYDRDPNKHSDAVRYERISYEQAIRDDLRFMDQTAIALCRENSQPIVVFDMSVSGNIHKVVVGETVGTIVSD